MILTALEGSTSGLGLFEFQFAGVAEVICTPPMEL